MVTHGRPTLLKKALLSLEIAKNKFEQAYPSKFDIRILINGEDSESTEALKGRYEFQKTSTSITPAAARNILLKNLESEWVFFMDDDIDLPEDIFKNFYNLINTEPEVEIWGGPNTTPASNEYLQKRNGWLLSCYLICGPVSNRYALRGPELRKGNQFNLMLCNLFIKSHCLVENNFLPLFKTAEENELIYRLQEKMSRARASDQLAVSHERRKDTTSFLRQIFFYGYGRGQLLCKTSILKQIPFALFPIFLLLAASISILFPWLIIFWLLLINFLYFIKFKKIDVAVVLLPPAIWIFYSMGIIKGAYSTIKEITISLKTKTQSD